MKYAEDVEVMKKSIRSRRTNFKIHTNDKEFWITYKEMLRCYKASNQYALMKEY